MTTPDADPHILSEGTLLERHMARSGFVRFVFDPPALKARLVSRSTVPAETAAEGAAVGGDRRRLGVAVRAIVLHGARANVMMHADDPALAEGFHPPEGTHRWTDGGGVIPAKLLAGIGGAKAIDVYLAETGLRYPLDGDAGATKTSPRP